MPLIFNSIQSMLDTYKQVDLWWGWQESLNHICTLRYQFPGGSGSKSVCFPWVLKFGVFFSHHSSIFFLDLFSASFPLPLWAGRQGGKMERVLGATQTWLELGYETWFFSWKENNTYFLAWDRGNVCKASDTLQTLNKCQLLLHIIQTLLYTM